MPRKEFQMTEGELNECYEAGKPVMCIMAGGIPPSSPREKANRFWRSLANKHGFVWDTVRPVNGKGDAFFTAEIVEDGSVRKP